MGKYLQNLEDLKKSEIGILDFIEKLAEENDLEYFLGYGSLLGAVRHQGFIPWDDDIDILVPRASYEKMRVLLQYSERYKIVSIHNDPEYIHSFMKIIDTYTVLEEEGMENLNQYGAFVDVFPLDGAPENKLLRRFHCWLIRKVSNAIAHSGPKTHSAGSDSKIKREAGVWLRNHYESFVLPKIVGRYDAKTSEYLGDLVGGSVAYPREVFDGVAYGEFEGKKYRIPYGYDEYLSVKYGNYMELPPVDQRVSRHKFSLYYK